MHTDGPTYDENFGVSKLNTVKIRRTAEMFQWVQRRVRMKKNNKTIYKYMTTKEWCENLVDDSNFHLNDLEWENGGQLNPKFMAIESAVMIND